MALPQRKIEQDDLFDPSAPAHAEAEVIAMRVPEPRQVEPQPEPQPLRVGEILKRERERRGYDLQQIADYLCIRRGLLVAIENSNYDAFPADAYVIGFLRSYAEIIGLDGQEAINHYRLEMEGRRQKPALVLPTPVSEGRAPTAVIMGAAAVASLLIYIFWYAFSTTDRTTVTTPPVLPTTTASTTSPVVTPVERPSTPIAETATTGSETLPPAAASGIAIAAPAPAPKTLAPLAPAPTAEPKKDAKPEAKTEPKSAEKPETKADTKAETKPEARAAQTDVGAPIALLPSPTAATAAAPHITIKADQSSWVLISDSKGQTVYDQVMKPNDTYQVPDTPGLSLTTGNGAGIILSVDDVKLPRLSAKPSQMVRDLPLDAKSLKAKEPQQ